MAEAVVNIVVEQLVSAAADWLKEEISLLRGVEPKLDNMKNRMQLIQTVLEDAENQSVKKKFVKLWLEKLQDVSYDMDDLLDEWSIRARIHKPERLEAEENTTSLTSPTAAKFTCFSLEKLNCFSSVKQLPWRRDIALRINVISKSIDKVLLEMTDFELASKAVGSKDMIKTINDIGRTTTAFVDVTKVYDRDDEKDFLLRIVLSRNTRIVLSRNTKQEKSPKLISIVGAGGLGKTTLAQMVYNDGVVKEKFGENRMWVCVSDPFDEVKVAQNILEGLKVDHTGMTSLQTLHQSIGESLSGSKFFLVLDDVWNESSNKWEKLRMCLNLGDPDSRILVTTRKKAVARMMGTAPSNILKPRLISDSDCWALMSQIAFQGRTSNGNDVLKDIGQKIAKKCKGLPLAAKTLGGMLISEESVDKWNEILYSEIWELEQAEVDLFPHIFLSYRELPAMLKRCFLILAIFPKDTKLKVEEVIRIWMAHGFLNPRNQKDDIVSTGEKYLKFLISRALLEDNIYSEILMHDIIHDFALHLLGNEVISMSVSDKIENDSGSMSTSERGLCLKWTTARHLCIKGKIDNTAIGFGVDKLRTCMIIGAAPNIITFDLVKRLEMVRALYLVNCHLEEVPESIGTLLHLRLLDLSKNNLAVSGLSSLPESIGNLTNLISLRHDIYIQYPESMGKLITLHILGEGYVAVGARANKLGFLKDLNQLRGMLRIVFESEYGDEDDAKKAAIEKKKHLVEFHLDFKKYKVTDGVIAALQPPSTIQVLRIDNPKSQLPCWITSLNHLSELQVGFSKSLTTLPPLGKLQSLKKLCLIYLFALKIIGRDFLGIDDHNNDEVFVAFPSLLELRIVLCSIEEWEDLKPEDEGKVIVMPKLQHVEFKTCRNFPVLPSRLFCSAASVEELRCEDCDSLAKYIKNDIPLLGRVKNVYINKQQCSLHPLAERGSGEDEVMMKMMMMMMNDD